MGRPHEAEVSCRERDGELPEAHSKRPSTAGRRIPHLLPAPLLLSRRRGPRLSAGAGLLPELDPVALGGLEAERADGLGGFARGGVVSLEVRGGQERRQGRGGKAQPVGRRHRHRHRGRGAGQGGGCFRGVFRGGNLYRDAEKLVGVEAAGADDEAGLVAHGLGDRHVTQGAARVEGHHQVHPPLRLLVTSRHRFPRLPLFVKLGPEPGGGGVGEGEGQIRHAPTLCASLGHGFLVHLHHLHAHAHWTKPGRDGRR
mmetsp:Transcript_60087/g.135856  ORF Transcript_60087/g.135856 Transcript_60087/m.135856 type:complete len:256 (-) Transcript_60087:195-962(-)